MDVLKVHLQKDQIFHTEISERASFKDLLLFRDLSFTCCLDCHFLEAPNFCFNKYLVCQSVLEHDCNLYPVPECCPVAEPDL